MSREIKFKFVIEDKFITRAYTLEEICEKSTEEIFEDAEVLHNPCTCTLSEAQTHCECNCMFENSNITNKIQFTGLHDKNGKEIYEGDILSFWDGGKVEPVIFREGCFWLGECGNYGENRLYCWVDSDKPDMVVEIIGNIYENGDLLK